jgi:hypothetical protein
VEEKENPMKSVIFTALTIAAAAASSSALAWNYIVVDKNGHETFLTSSPVDLTYPPSNEHMQVMYEGDFTPPSGTPLTRQQELFRRQGNTLIIADVTSAQHGEGWIGSKAAPQLVSGLADRP